MTGNFQERKDTNPQNEEILHTKWNQQSKSKSKTMKKNLKINRRENTHYPLFLNKRRRRISLTGNPIAKIKVRRK